MAGQTVIVSVLADTRRFNSAMGGTDRTLRRFSDNLRRVNTVGLAVFTGIAVAVGRFTIDAINAADAAGAIDARLANTAEQMRLFGKETETVVKRLQDFASDTEKAIAVDDDLIKQTQTVLLTFKNLATTADDLGGSFDKATVLAFDLAATFGGDGVTNAKLLGKALNDPIRGVTSLSRVGVQFTDKQREQIAAFVETNNVAKAQRIILKELERQVGGNAEAGATAAQKLKTSFGNLQEVFGENILGKFSDDIELLADQLYKFSQTEEFTVFAEEIGESLKEIVKDLPVFVTEVANFLKGLRDNGMSLVDFAKVFIGLQILIPILANSFAILGGAYGILQGRIAKTRTITDLTDKIKGLNYASDENIGTFNNNERQIRDWAEKIKDGRHETEKLRLKMASLIEENRSIKKQWRDMPGELDKLNGKLDETRGLFGKIKDAIFGTAEEIDQLDTKFGKFARFGGRFLGVVGIFFLIVDAINFVRGAFDELVKAFERWDIAGTVSKWSSDILAGFGTTWEQVAIDFNETALGKILQFIIDFDAYTLGQNFMKLFTDGVDSIIEGKFKGIWLDWGNWLIDFFGDLFPAEDFFPSYNPSAPAASPSPSSPNRPSTSPSVTVNVSALAPSPEIGRNVVAAIADYERTSGRRFA